MAQSDSESNVSEYGSSFFQEEDPPKDESVLEYLTCNYDYNTLNRGLIDDNSRIISCCDLEYLHAIMFDMDMLVEVMIREPVNSEEGRKLWHNGLSNLLRELDRLLRQPALIQDTAVRDPFFKYVENFCALFEDDPAILPEENLIHDINALLRKEHHSSYDPKRLPWHQFLHQYAPGSGSTVVNGPHIQNIGIRQIIPPAGLKILRAWEQDIRDMQRIVCPTEPPEIYRGITKPAAHQEYALGGRIRYRLVGIIPEGPTAFDERVEPNSQSLESLSRELGRWDVATEEGFHANQAPFMFVAECTESEWLNWKSLSRDRDIPKSDTHAATLSLFQ